MSLKTLFRLGVGFILVAGLALPPAAQAASRASSLRTPTHAAAQTRFEALLSFLVGVLSGGTMQPDGNS